MKAWKDGVGTLEGCGGSGLTVAGVKHKHLGSPNNTSF